MDNYKGKELMSRVEVALIKYILVRELYLLILVIKENLKVLLYNQYQIC